jgi:type I restriction enzyme S subunit
MKNNWQIKKLEEICEFFADGDWIEKKDQSTSGIRLIQTGNIGNGSFLDRIAKARYISESTFKRLRCAEVLPGDCLLSRLPDPVGRAGLIPETGQKMITAVDCTIMRFKKDILPKWFIYYSLSQGYQNEINKEVTGATRQRISRSDLGNIKIPVPPVSEQKQLVKVIDVVFKKTAKAKENAEKNLRNARELFDSYLQSVFANPGVGWETCNLEDYIKLIDYRGRTPVKTKTGIRLITAKNVKLGYLQLEPQEFIHPDNYNSWMTRGIPNIGDVIFTTEAPLANLAQLDTTDKVAFAQRIIVMQPQLNKINQAFLKYLLISIPIRRKILAKGTGATVLGIKSRLLKKIEIYFPKSLKEQEAIVQKLEALSSETKKLEVIYQQKLADLEELKKSILNRAFKGDLTKDNRQ